MKDIVENSIVLLLILLVSVSSMGPLVGPGSAIVEKRLPENTPKNCITPSPRQVSSPSEAAIEGTIHQNKSNPRQVDIEYEQLRPNSTTTVYLPYGATLVSKQGFDEAIPSGLVWNESANIHRIVFETAKTDLVEIPHGKSWMMTGLPSHSHEKVHLRPQPDGYIGADIAYLGEFSVKNATVGCQTFEVIVPKKSPPQVRPERRLQELKVAARSLPVDHYYSTVRIFVSPNDLGSAAGVNYRFGNEIIVHASPGEYASVLWIHEYVHTLQDFRPKPDFYWFIEASAQYLSMRVAVENGFIPPRGYDFYFARIIWADQNRSLGQALHHPIAYHKGAAVLASVENNFSDQNNVTIAHSLNYINSRRNPGYSDFEAYLQNEGGLNDSELNHTRQVVMTDKRIEPPYLLGPDIPNEIRIALAMMNLFVVRLMSAVIITIFAIAFAYDRYLKDRLPHLKGRG